MEGGGDFESLMKASCRVDQTARGQALEGNGKVWRSLLERRHGIPFNSAIRGCR